MRRLFLLLAVLASLVLTGCGTTVGVDGPIVTLPPETQAKIDGACDKFEGFRDRYVEARPVVVANREWIEELMPGVWSLLVDFDKNAGDYADIFSLVCRVISGDPTARAELEVKRADVERRNVDWNSLLTNATKLATLFLAR